MHCAVKILFNQGRIYSFGEEGMQLVQPSKFFSVTIFNTFYGHAALHARMRTWAMLLYLVTLKNFMSVQLLWELHARFFGGVYIISP